MLQILVVVFAAQLSFAGSEVFVDAVPLNTDLKEATSYHEYLHDKVPVLREEFLKSYNENPVAVCDTLNTADVKTLLDYREVFEQIEAQISCARLAATRIDDYYYDYSRFFEVSAQSLNATEIRLEKAYSLPEQLKLPPKTINLTFDDGPHKRITQSLLNTLSGYGVKANFFVLGQNARRYPDLVKDIASYGHSVGAHSMTHKDLAQTEYNVATKEILDTFDVIEKILGGVDPFFRFPYGSRTRDLRNFLAQNNISDFFWTIDSLDWKYKNPDDLLKFTISETNRMGRGIILFHDIQPQTDAMMRSYLDYLSGKEYSTAVYLP